MMKLFYFETKTGLGYYKNSLGQIIAKADLPPGRHIIRDGFFFIEVNNRDELDHVEIYEDPEDILKENQEFMVSKKTRLIAIQQLIAEGKLPADYKED